MARRFTRGVVVAALLAASVVTSTGPAGAQPSPPANSSDAMKRFEELSKQAEAANEELLQAQEDQKAKRAEADKAAADAVNAKKAEDEAKVTMEQFRGQVDELSAASLNGARFSSMSALLTGESQRDFLDRASALKVLAAENDHALSTMANAVNAAEQARTRFEQAQRTAEESAAAADRLVGEIKQRAEALNKQANEARAAKNNLTRAEKKQLEDPGDTNPYFPGGSGASGVAAKAVEVALAQRGDTYVYGKTGPDQFDCSGLTMFAYRAAGLTLPRTSKAQYGVGTPVASGQWIPGDLLFYGSSAASIHHVAMYIGDGKIVHASTEGVPVKVDTVRGGGSDYFAAKRVAG